MYALKSQLPAPQPDHQFVLRLQGVRGGGFGPVCDVARLGHQQASRAAYLLWRHLPVYPAAVPVVHAQDGGEFSQPAECVELPWRQPFRNAQRCYCGTLSVAAFAETWENVCPCAPVVFTVIFGISRIASW